MAWQLSFQRQSLEQMLLPLSQTFTGRRLGPTVGSDPLLLLKNSPMPHRELVQIPEPHPTLDSELVSLWWDLGLCIPNRLPGDADAALREPPRLWASPFSSTPESV